MSSNGSGSNLRRGPRSQMGQQMHCETRTSQSPFSNFSPCFPKRTSEKQAENRVAIIGQKLAVCLWNNFLLSRLTELNHCSEERGDNFVRNPSILAHKSHGRASFPILCYNFNDTCRGFMSTAASKGRYDGQ
jgi:hypothetical protein